MQFHGLILLFSVLTSVQAFAGVVYNDSRPLPDGSCPQDHGILIEEFTKKQFENLTLNGQAGVDDEYNGTTAYRQNQQSSNGNTKYAIDLYGRTPDDQRIPPIDENDDPNGTRDYRCFGHLVVTNTCQVVMVPTDFMDSEKLRELGQRALEKLQDEARRNGEELETDQDGYIGVQVSVPKVNAFTCDRPESFVGM